MACPSASIVSKPLRAGVSAAASSRAAAGSAWPARTTPAVRRSPCTGPASRTRSSISSSISTAASACSPARRTSGRDHRRCSRKRLPKCWGSALERLRVVANDSASHAEGQRLVLVARVVHGRQRGDPRRARAEATAGRRCRAQARSRGGRCRVPRRDATVSPAPTARSPTRTSWPRRWRMPAR